jgi:hypothetical protein
MGVEIMEACSTTHNAPAALRWRSSPYRRIVCKASVYDNVFLFAGGFCKNVGFTRSLIRVFRARPSPEQEMR